MEHLLKKYSWHKSYLEIARIIGNHSYAENLKVGAILVKDGRIISTGYNGTPHGFDNICEIDGVTKPNVLHAESNAIAKCARSVESSEDSILYTCASPCIECAKLIIQAGIIEVYYSQFYRSQAGLDLLTEAKIYHELI